MYTIPKSIIIRDKEFAITNDGDYRMVLDCFEALNDIELTEQYRVLTALIIFYKDVDGIEDLSLYNIYLEDMVREMYRFMNCGEENPFPSSNRAKLIDWEMDSQLICSAINRVANLEIRAVPYCHWWTFMGYYSAIGESPLSTVVSIRNKIAKGKKLEKYESDFKRDNPHYFNRSYRTTEQLEQDKLVRSIWNSNSKGKEE